MSLRKSPTMTPARLAANPANAAKSTGPRTRAGKNRVRWNALKRGEHARSFREALIGMGENPRWFDFLYDWISYKPEDAAEEAEALALARDLWWAYVGNGSEEAHEFFQRTDPECALESVREWDSRAGSRQPIENRQVIKFTSRKAVK